VEVANPPADGDRNEEDVRGEETTTSCCSLFTWEEVVVKARMTGAVVVVSSARIIPFTCIVVDGARVPTRMFQSVSIGLEVKHTY